MATLFHDTWTQSEEDASFPVQDGRSSFLGEVGPHTRKAYPVQAPRWEACCLDVIQEEEHVEKVCQRRQCYFQEEVRNYVQSAEMSLALMQAVLWFEASNWEPETTWTPNLGWDIAMNDLQLRSQKSC